MRFSDLLAVMGNQVARRSGRAPLNLPNGLFVLMFVYRSSCCSFRTLLYGGYTHYKSVLNLTLPLRYLCSADTVFLPSSYRFVAVLMWPFLQLCQLPALRPAGLMRLCHVVESGSGLDDGPTSMILMVVVSETCKVVRRVAVCSCQEIRSSCFVNKIKFVADSKCQPVIVLRWFRFANLLR